MEMSQNNVRKQLTASIVVKLLENGHQLVQIRVVLTGEFAFLIRLDTIEHALVNIMSVYVVIGA